MLNLTDIIINIARTITSKGIETPRIKPRFEEPEVGVSETVFTVVVEVRIGEPPIKTPSAKEELRVEEAVWASAGLSTETAPSISVEPAPKLNKINLHASKSGFNDNMIFIINAVKSVEILPYIDKGISIASEKPTLFCPKHWVPFKVNPDLQVTQTETPW